MQHLTRFLKRSEDPGFTLIELLVVIAILAVLAVAVVLVLNPAELLKQGRDSTRLSDLASLTSAIALLQTDVSNLSLGSSSVAYLSLIDPTATTTAGTDCSGLGFPTPGFHCAASSTVSKTDGTGWIPINFTRFSAGSPLGRLPLDPVNNASSSLFYAYFTDGTTWKVTAAPESARYSQAPQGFQGGSNKTLAGGFPEGWVKVPGNSAFGTNDFWVMKYEAKCAQGGVPLGTPGAPYDTGFRTYYDSSYPCTSANGKVVTSAPQGFPIAYINHATAKTYCQSIGGHLLTNDEWMTIARNAEAVESNWTGGTVGSGALYSGHNDNSPAFALEASPDDTNGYAGTGQTAPANQRRTFTLSNGSVIWDLPGNVYEHVQRSTLNVGDITTTIDLPPCSDGAASWGWCQFGNSTTPYVTTWTTDVVQAKVGPSNTSWNSSQGMGQVYTYKNGVDQGTTVFIRGAGWGAGSLAGAFALHLYWVTGSTGYNVGFRCAR